MITSNKLTDLQIDAINYWKMPISEFEVLSLKDKEYLVDAFLKHDHALGVNITLDEGSLGKTTLALSKAVKGIETDVSDALSGADFKLKEIIEAFKNMETTYKREISDLYKKEKD